MSDYSHKRHRFSSLLSLFSSKLYYVCTFSWITFRPEKSISLSLWPWPNVRVTTKKRYLYLLFLKRWRQPELHWLVYAKGCRIGKDVKLIPGPAKIIASRLPGGTEENHYNLSRARNSNNATLENKSGVSLLLPTNTPRSTRWTTKGKKRERKEAEKGKEIYGREQITWRRKTWRNQRKERGMKNQEFCVVSVSKLFRNVSLNKVWLLPGDLRLKVIYNKQLHNLYSSECTVWRIRILLHISPWCSDSGSADTVTASGTKEMSLHTLA
jgi:hypothetical protein